MAVLKGLSGNVTVHAGNSSRIFANYGVADVHPAHKVLTDDTGLYFHRGFSRPQHYMLGADAPGGNMVVEPGRTTRVFYFAAKGSGGLTYADIETAEGLAPRSVNAVWVVAQGTSGLTISPARYGETEDHPLDTDLETEIMEKVYETEVTSPHVYFNGADTHDTPRAPFDSGVHACKGESALHPMLFTSYGSGAATIDGSTWTTSNASVSNIVFQNLDWRSDFEIRGGAFSASKGMRCVLFDRFELSEGHISTETSGQFHERLTFRDCYMHDCVLSAPLGNGGADWSDPNADRFEAYYCSTTLYPLFHRCHFDHNGWADGYDASGLTFPLGQPISSYSHNVYMADSVSHATVRETFSNRASNSGMQLRGNGFCLFSHFIDNNVAHQISAPPAAGDQNTYMELVHHTIMSMGHRFASYSNSAWQGAVDWNISLQVADTTTDLAAVTHEVIIAHSSDPNDSADVTEKQNAGGSTINLSLQSVLDRFWQSTPSIVKYRWGNSADFGSSELNQDEMDAATVGSYMDTINSRPLGTYTTDDFCDYLRSLGTGAGDEAFDVWNYFAPAYGFTEYTRITPTTLTFAPYKGGNGFRYEDPRNWSSEGWPGLHADDSANLNGETILIYEELREHPTLDMGAGGTLHVWGGKTTAETSWLGTGTIEVHEGGQFAANCDPLGPKVVNLSGGRCQIGAAITDNLTISAKATEDEVEILIDEGNSLTIADSQSLILIGGSIFCGFDGDAGGAVSLTIAPGGTLAFIASGGEIATIREFYSGIHGFDQYNRTKTPNVASAVAFDAEAIILAVDTSGLRVGTYTLIDVDKLIVINPAKLPSGVTVSGNRLEVVVG